MDPTHLSASAIKTYESCPARFYAENVVRARQASGVAADLGTAAHEALEKWTTNDLMEFGPDGLSKLLDRFATESAILSLPDEQIQQGRKMLKGTYERLEENPPYEILSVEVKEDIEIPITKNKKIKFTYIYDRCDRMEDGSIDVVDFKSWFQALDPATAKTLVQVRMYALTAAIKYKDQNPPAIWVTLDQLRYGTVSVKFTRDDIREIYAYFKDVVQRIWADDGTREQVNPECRYCIRKDSCESLQKVIQVNPDGVLATDDFDIIGEQMAETYEAIKALGMQLETYEDWLDGYLEEHRIPEAATSSGIVVKYSPTSRRSIDSERVAKAVGPELSQQYGKFSMGDVDTLLKSDDIDENVKDELKGLIKTNISTRVTARYPKK